MPCAVWLATTFRNPDGASNWRLESSAMRMPFAALLAISYVTFSDTTTSPWTTSSCPTTSTSTAPTTPASTSVPSMLSSPAPVAGALLQHAKHQGQDVTLGSSFGSEMASGSILESEVTSDTGTNLNFGASLTFGVAAHNMSQPALTCPLHGHDSTYQHVENGDDCSLLVELALASTTSTTTPSMTNVTNPPTAGQTEAGDEMTVLPDAVDMFDHTMPLNVASTTATWEIGEVPLSSLVENAPLGTLLLQVQRAREAEVQIVEPWSQTTMDAGAADYHRLACMS